ncbi:MAG TPA: hypothetical protein VNZ44_16275, partial [Pyrinomonadaceae bacterium]|nr:hypothetical protein [Pyrinomonadaceae bacterium]
MVEVAASSAVVPRRAKGAEQVFMHDRIKPLLSAFERELPGAGTVSHRDPQCEVTSLDVVYRSTLLDPHALSGGGDLISKYTKVLTETTDDE